MKKLIGIVLCMCMILVGTPVFAKNNSSNQQQQGQIGINRNNNDLSNTNRNANLQGQGQQQGITDSGNSNNSNNNRNNNKNNNTATGGNASQGQGQQQGQGQGQAQGQGQGQAQAAVAAQQQGQANVQGTDVNVGGDTFDTTTYVMTAPDTIANEGQTAFSGYSIFGGLNLVETEEAKGCMERIVLIDQMQKSGLMSKEQALDEAQLAFKQLKDAQRTKRILSFGPRTTGRHIFNAFGILSTDDGYNAIDKWTNKKK